MTKPTIEKLEARIKAVNTANATANNLYTQLAQTFTPLIGQQILKQNGDLLLKIENKLPPLPNTTKLRAYYRKSNFSLNWTISANEQSDTNTHYHETTITIGELNGLVLANITPPHIQKTDYSVEEIERLRKAYTAAKKIADTAHSALQPFGEHDR